MDNLNEVSDIETDISDIEDFAEDTEEFEALNDEDLNGDMSWDEEEDIVDSCVMEESDKEGMMRDILEQNVAPQKLPSDARVIWDDIDMKGDSSCKLRDDTELKIHYKSDNNDIVYSGKEFKEHMLDSYGIDSVEYSHREPDFEPFEKPIDAEDFSAFMLERHGRDVAINQLDEGHVSVENMSTSRGGGDGTFAEANSIMAEKLGDNVSKKDVEDYMNSRDLTWHECGDRHTIRIIPSEINQAFSHTGGIGLQKDFDAMADEISEITDGRKIVLERTKMGGTAENLQEAIDDAHNRFSERKRYNQ